MAKKGRPIKFHDQYHKVQRELMRKQYAKKRKCKVHTGPKGGKFVMERKKGGGTKRKYL